MIINSTVKLYQGKKLTLNSGQELKVDIVIQATGWTLDLPFLPSHIKKKLIDETNALF